MNVVADLARAAIFVAPGKPFQFREFPIPSPGAGEILVRVTCSTICGSDRHTFHGRRHEPTPCVLGHEITGRVAGFGPGTPRTDLAGRPLAEGDRITWTIAASCGDCFFCRHQLPQKCERLFKYGHSAIAPGRELSGGFADHCVLRPGTGVVRLPDALDDAIAAPANCAVATVAAVLRTAGDPAGATVAVIGTGILGIHACAMARHLGASEVIACDLDPDRASLALEFGATRFCAPAELPDRCRDLTAGRGADLSLELSGASTGVATALACLRTGGRAVVAGTVSPVDPIPLDSQDLVRRMIRIEGVHNYAPQDLVTALSFLTATAGLHPFERLIGRRFKLDEIDTAFASPTAGLRSVIVP